MELLQSLLGAELGMTAWTLIKIVAIVLPLMGCVAYLTLAERKVKTHEAMNYFLKVLCLTDQHVDPTQGLINERALKKVQAMYEGQGHGSDLASASLGLPPCPRQPPSSVNCSAFATLAPCSA